MGESVEREIRAYSAEHGPLYGGGKAGYHSVDAYSAKYGQLCRTGTKPTLRERREQKTEEMRKEASRKDE